MAMVLLTSAAGSPGVTTTAVGLARCWPGDTLLVDADRHPTQAVLAGFLNGSPAVGRGLTGLARVHRERRSVEHELLMHCVPLGEDTTHRRMLLPGFSHPGSPALFGPIWPELTTALTRIQTGGTNIIVDCGRLGDGLPAPLLTAADAVLVVARTSLRALAGVRLYLPQLQQRLEGLAAGTQLGLVLVGEGRPYTAKEISSQFGVAVWGSIAHQPRAARVWSEGAAPFGRFEHSALARTVRGTIATIRSHTETAEEMGRL
jgi:cellulose biosynthesis protein BcsQ